MADWATGAFKIAKTGQSGSPRCSSCGRPLIAWDERHTVEDCARFEGMPDSEKREVEQYVAALSGLSKGRIAEPMRCPVCAGRGWHTAGGNDPMICNCPAGEAYAADWERPVQDWENEYAERLARDLGLDA